MIGDLFLATYGIGTGGEVGNLLYQMESAGIFAYVLPFLMLFAIINAILARVGIFGDNKAVNVILALAVSLMALQFKFVSYFFAEIFPRMGVLLSIIIVAVILLGLFFDFGEDGVPKYIFGGLVAIGFIVIVVQSFDIFNWGFGLGGFGGTWGWWIEDNISMIMVLALVGGAIAWIVKGSGNSNGDKPTKRRK